MSLAITWPNNLPQLIDAMARSPAAMLVSCVLVVAALIVLLFRSAPILVRVAAFVVMLVLISVVIFLIHPPGGFSTANAFVVGATSAIERSTSIETSTDHAEDLKTNISNLTKAAAPLSRLQPAIVPKPGSNWRRLDSSSQRGFYDTQLDELAQKLTEARVAPDGVKFMFGVGVDEPHHGYISVLVRVGDDLPVVYSIKQENNSGVPGNIESMITTMLEALKDLKYRAILPIGWSYHSNSFIYATAELRR